MRPAHLIGKPIEITSYNEYNEFDLTTAEWRPALQRLIAIVRPSLISVISGRVLSRIRSVELMDERLPKLDRGVAASL